MRMRDGVETMSMSGKTTLPTIPGLTHDDRRYVHYYVIYPNMLLSPHPDYVLTHTAWPIAPDRTHVVCEWLFTEEAVHAKGLRSARRRRILGRDQPPGLGAVRTRASRNRIARLSPGTLSAD